MPLDDLLRLRCNRDLKIRLAALAILTHRKTSNLAVDVLTRYADDQETTVIKERGLPAWNELLAEAERQLEEEKAKRLRPDPSSYGTTSEPGPQSPTSNAEAAEKLLEQTGAVKQRKTATK